MATTVKYSDGFGGRTGNLDGTTSDSAGGGSSGSWVLKAGTSPTIAAGILTGANGATDNPVIIDNAPAYGGEQKGTITLGASANGGVVLMWTPGTGTGTHYLLYLRLNGFELYRVVNGSYSQVASNSGASPGDVFDLYYDGGGDFEIRRNGTAVAFYTDGSPLPDGQPGVDIGTGAFDDFVYADANTGGTPVALAGTLRSVPRLLGAALTVGIALAGTSRVVERVRGAALSQSVALAGKTRVVERLGPANLAFANGYSYRKIVTIDRTKVSGGPHADFPYEYSITDPKLATVANGGRVTSSTGDDIRFERMDGTKLDHEIDVYDPVAGTIVAHIRCPNEVSSLADGKIIRYYGKSGAGPEENPTGVWVSGYKGVYHFGDGSTLDLNDSTANANNGTGQSSPTAAAGKIGGALSLDGSLGQHVRMDSIAAMLQSGSASISAWVKFAADFGASDTVTRNVVHMGDLPSVNDLIPEFANNSFGASSGKYLSTLNYGNGGNQTHPPFNQTSWDHTLWYFVYFVHDAATGTTIAYINGAVGTNTTGLTRGTSPLGTECRIGRSVNGLEYWMGLLDEIRLSSVVRSPDWILTEYNNQSAPGSFFSEGSEESSGSAALAGTIRLVERLTGTLGQTIPLAGKLRAVERLTGATLDISTALAGTVRCVERLRGAALSSDQPLAGTVRTVERLTGVLGESQPLAGTLRVVERALGATLDTAAVLTGTVRSVERLRGAALSSAQPLVGTLRSVERLTGQLGTDQALAGKIRVVERLLGASSDEPIAMEGNLRVVERLRGAHLDSSVALAGTCRVVERCTGSFAQVAVLQGTARSLERLRGAALTATIPLTGKLRVVERLRGALGTSAHLAGKIRVVERCIGRLGPRVAMAGRCRVVERLRGAHLTITRVVGPGCTLASTILAAQMETGLDVGNVTSEATLGKHILRYRQRLVARCANRWKDVERETLDLGVTELGEGWGDHFGDDWGGTIGGAVLPITDMEAIWEVRAHRILTDEWEIAHVITINDDRTLLKPTLLLRHGEAVLLHFTEDWLGIYDFIRFEGVGVPAVIGINERLTALEPNQLTAPAFCRCLTLEAAKLMSLQDGDLVAAAGFASDLAEAEADLLSQVESHNLTIASRQCQRP